MIDQDPDLKVSTIVECVGVCLVLVDGSSPIASAHWWDDAKTPRERGAALTRAVNGHDAFLWAPLLDGIFRIDFSFGPVPFDICEGMSVEPLNLNLPTGKLILRTTVMSVEVFRIEPGTYQGIFVWDLAQESRHSGLSSVDSYPSNEGPDGWIFLKGRI